MKKALLIGMVAVIGLSLVSPIWVNAQSLDDIAQQEQAAQSQAAQIDVELQNALTAVNEKYSQISNLQTQIDDANQRLEEYQQQIEETQTSIDRRTEVANAQLRNMQLNGGQEGILDMLLSSENITDFITRSMALTTIRNAQNEKVRSLVADVEHLNELKEQQATTTIQLAQNKATMSQEVENMQVSVDNLRAQAANNQAVLQNLSNQRTAEEERIRDEAREQAQREADERAAQDAANNQQNNTPSAPATPATPPPSQSTGTGRFLDVQATAYSMNEPGMGFITAIGIDLRVNPWVIAVDPSVIPLGSIVEVPGYGIAIAGDTGGKIRGHIIDVHMVDVAAAWQWGRRNITIKILD